MRGDRHPPFLTAPGAPKVQAPKGQMPDLKELIGVSGARQQLGKQAFGIVSSNAEPAMYMSARSVMQKP